MTDEPIIGTYIDLERFTVPFPTEAIEWRIQSSGFKKDGTPWGKVLAYVTNRAIMERLDAVCGPDKWINEFRPLHTNGILCGISLLIDGEWITKWDGAELTDIEPVKGGLSNAMKRAAVQWGIGRYLYDLGDSWAIFTDKQGQYKSKISDKSGKEEWHSWDPPALPDWALPKGAAAIDNKDVDKKITEAWHNLGWIGKHFEYALRDYEKETGQKSINTPLPPDVKRRYLEVVNRRLKACLEIAGIRKKSGWNLVQANGLLTMWRKSKNDLTMMPDGTDKTLHDLTVEDCEAYLAYLKEKGS